MASRVMPKSTEHYVLLLLGPSEAGKSTAGNFILGKSLFPTADDLLSVTGQTKQHKIDYNGVSLRLIDTVGLDDSQKTSVEVVRDLTTAVLMASEYGGVASLLICVDLLASFSGNFKTVLEDLERMKNFWPHAILLLTNSGKYGNTDSEREAKYQEVMSSPQCPAELRWVVDNVGDRRVFIEHDDLELGDVRKRKIDSIVSVVRFIQAERGVYTNPMIQAAKQYWEEYKIWARQPPSPFNPSMEELALRILRYVRELPGDCKRFSQIYAGIEEWQRRQGVLFAQTLPGRAYSMWTNEVPGFGGSRRSFKN